MPEPIVKPFSLSFEELMTEVEAGVLKIPAFQRGFVWKPDQTLGLLDSIAKRYPVGAFLIWETTEFLDSLREIGGMALPQVPEGREVKYVLDGQQRITSLYAAATGGEIDGESYEVFLDLDADLGDERLFQRDGPASDRYVPLSGLLGDSPYLLTQGLSPERLARFHKVHDAFLKYNFPCVLVKHQPIDAACEMFTRVNTGGTPLKLFDIMLAKTWSPEFNLRDRWGELDQTLSGVGYDRLDPPISLQALCANVRGAISEREIFNISRAEVCAAWPHTAECMKRAVDYLRQSARVPGTRLLSYPSIIVVLSHFFHLNKGAAPTREQTGRLVSYVCRAGLSQRYGGNPSSTVREDLRLMERIAAGKPGEVPITYPVGAELISDTRLRTSSAFCRAVLATMASCRPVSIADGSEIILDNSFLAQANSKHYHHIFPKAYLRAKGCDDARINALPNIMFVPAQPHLTIGAQAPSKSLSKFSTTAGDAWDKWMHTHLITTKAWQAAMADDYDTFLSLRAKSIADRCNRLMGLSAQDVKEKFALMK